MAQLPEYEKKILEEVEFLKNRYFTYDEPVPFCGMNMYPVTLRNYNEFMVCISCLTLNKYDDPLGIKYTNLEYLLNKIQNNENNEEGQRWSAKLSRLIELCFHVVPGMKCDKCGDYMSYEEYILRAQSAKTEDDLIALSKCKKCDGSYVPSLSIRDDENKRKILIIDGHEIDQNNFNRMRKFILYQNLPDYYDDSFEPKALRDNEAKKNEILSRDSGTATLEQKVCAVSFQTGMSMERVYDLPIRKFMILSKMINDYTEYLATKIGISSGMIKLKDGQSIDHWLYKKEKENRYGANVSADELIHGVQG